MKQREAAVRARVAGGKAAAALVLLLVGGMLGYFMGGRGACRQGMMNMPVQSQEK